MRTILLFSIAILSFCPVAADAAQGQGDPLVGPSTDWVSVDSFVKKGQMVTVPDAPVVPESAAAPAVTAPVLTPAPAEAKPEQAATKPAISPGYPSLPASGPDVVLSLTEEDRGAEIAEKKDWAAVPDAQAEAKRQEDARKAVEAAALAKAKSKDALGVRFSTLPNLKVQAVPADRISKPKLEREAKAAAAMKAAQGGHDPAPSPKQTAQEGDTTKSAKTAEGAQGAVAGKQAVADKKTELKAREVNAACEAFADFHRRQLEALESDRRTLAELRNALSELGLVKKLSFMSGDNGALVHSTEAQNDPKLAVQASSEQKPQGVP